MNEKAGEEVRQWVVWYELRVGAWGKERRRDTVQARF